MGGGGARLEGSAEDDRISHRVTLGKKVTARHRPRQTQENMAAPASTSSEAAKGMIRLHLHVHDHHFIQPCKEGNQTVKWLSMVASQRFAMTQTPRGERVVGAVP